MNATPVGALLLCRAVPESVRPPAHLLREPMVLTPAGDGWSALVPEGRPWRDGGPHGAEPVDRVTGGWAAALAVGSTWPVIALWWDGDRAGYTLASGFRRPVGYVWLADGTPAGEDEAMRTFAARLGLDPVLDVQALEALTRPDPGTDAGARLRGLLAVLARTGAALPPGVGPCEPADRLRAAAGAHREAERIEWAGWRDAVRVELDAVESGRLGPWVRGPRARTIAAAQLALGVPLLLTGAGRRSAGWLVAGAVLVAQGALGLAYNRIRDEAEG
ncbi:hypothetical protein [Streptomyces fulvorobeus]|uniref:Uncharacterized protein n=1 Tax=Streptomyces fulvorobeus TaxID=284028 RepID=A0A7J0CA64_9ACTN|nr:hypothetical protein [Streptomyces fulvorobeus]NYE42914.1 hypothetical protein [Streptomyces fulvorobeus]GFM99342.1 hypothetical protein Sfulv_41530 [Streptomyces fulvorobeus]